MIRWLFTFCLEYLRAYTMWSKFANHNLGHRLYMTIKTIMAAPMPRSSKEESAINPKCFVHLKSVSPAEKAQFVTNVRWSKIVECSKKWINLFGNEKELAEKLVSLDLLELSYEEDGWQAARHRVPRYVLPSVYWFQTSDCSGKAL